MHPAERVSASRHPHAMPSLALALRCLTVASTARKAFDANCQDVNRLLDVHGQIGGSGPGRRYGLEVLNKSAVVLVTAFWEAYCEDLATEALQHLVEKAETADKLPLELRKHVARELARDEHELAVWQLASNENGRINQLTWQTGSQVVATRTVCHHGNSQVPRRHDAQMVVIATTMGEDAMTPPVESAPAQTLKQSRRGQRRSCCGFGLAHSARAASLSIRRPLGATPLKNMRPRSTSARAVPQSVEKHGAHERHVGKISSTLTSCPASSHW